MEEIDVGGMLDASPGIFSYEVGDQIFCDCSSRRTLMHKGNYGIVVGHDTVSQRLECRFVIPQYQEMIERYDVTVTTPEHVKRERLSGFVGYFFPESELIPPTNVKRVVWFKMHISNALLCNLLDDAKKRRRKQHSERPTPKINVNGVVWGEDNID